MKQTNFVRMMLLVGVAVLSTFGSSSTHAGIILNFDSVLPASGGSSSDLTRIDSETDASFVSSSGQFSISGAEITGGFQNNGQNNVDGLGDQADLTFRFGSGASEVTLANGNAGVIASSTNGNYLTFSFVAAQAQTLTQFAFETQANSQSGSLFGARDFGVFVEVGANTGFNQFGAIVDRTGTGVFNNAGGGAFINDNVLVAAGDLVTYRLAFADKTSTVQTLQAGTRIGNVRISAIAVPVPEPSSLALLGIAAIGFCGFRRRRS